MCATAEVPAAEAHRTLAQARSAVASAKQNRSGFFPSSNAPSSQKGNLKGNRKIHRVSSVAEVTISGGSVVTWQRRYLWISHVLLGSRMEF